MADEGLTSLKDYIALVMRIFPASEWGNALAIMYRESRGNPKAHNTKGEDSRGLFQINVAAGAHPELAEMDLFDPAENVQIAYKLWQEQGWSPWGGKPDIPTINSMLLDWSTILDELGAKISVGGTVGWNPSQAVTPLPGGQAARDMPAEEAKNPCPDWQFGVTSLPGTGYITCFFKAIGELLRFLVNPETWIALIIRGILTIFGLIILGASLFALLNSLGE